MDLIVEGVGNQNPDTYCALLDNDQLIPCLATAATFPGFQELTLPSFAPTYKKKVRMGSVGDGRRATRQIRRATRARRRYTAATTTS